VSGYIFPRRGNREHPCGRFLDPFRVKARRLPPFLFSFQEKKFHASGRTLADEIGPTPFFSVGGEVDPPWDPLVRVFLFLHFPRVQLLFGKSLSDLCSVHFSFSFPRVRGSSPPLGRILLPGQSLVGEGFPCRQVGRPLAGEDALTDEINGAPSSGTAPFASRELCLFFF